jgi:hypothetical protein
MVGSSRAMLRGTLQGQAGPALLTWQGDSHALFIPENRDLDKIRNLVAVARVI